MDLKTFLFVFLAAYLANVLQGGIVAVILYLRMKSKLRKEKALEAIYLRAVKYMNDGNQEAAEAMAAKFRETSGGKGMPPIILVEAEEEGGV